MKIDIKMQGKDQFFPYVVIFFFFFFFFLFLLHTGYNTYTATYTNYKTNTILISFIIQYNAILGY